jgi:quercetin dioxygenase-like cupin family protein
MGQDSTLSPAIMPVIRGPGIGPSHNVVGATHIYKLLPAEAGGALAAWEVIVEPGAGAPPHRHADEEEAFYVVEGSIVIAAGVGPAQRLGPGSFFFSPRGVPHAFHNDGRSRAKLLVLASPATGLVQMFGEMDEAATAAGGMAPLAEIVDIAARHGVAILPPG